MRPAGGRGSSGGPSSASTSGPTSPQRNNDTWDLSIFKVPKPKSCIFWCKHCPPGLRRFLLWLWLFVGLAAAVTAAVIIIRNLKVNRQRDLELECKNRANVLQSELRAAADQALMYSGFVLTLQGNLTQQNFQTFGEATIRARFLLGRIAYLIRVTQAQRPLLDTPFFPFTQYAPNSSTIQVPRDNASEYALVRYTGQVPLRGNVFGLDLAADPVLSQTIFEARDTGKEQLSPPRILYNGLLGFVIVSAVYEPVAFPESATVQQRRDACIGYTYAQVNAQSLANNVFANFSDTRVESRVYDVTTEPPQDTNLLYARHFQNNNGSGSSATLLDQGTNLTVMLPKWKPDYAIPIYEQSRIYSLQCRRTNPGNARIVMTGVGYAILIMFVVLMAALTMYISFKRLDSMEKEAARMHIVSERLSMAKAAAEAADTAKGRFLATVSHEIRTPLNGVLGCMSLLLDTPLNDVQLDYVRTARASGKALVALVNDVLDLSKVEAGAMELECEPFDIRSLIEDILGMFASTTREKGLELAGLVRDGVPETVVGDAGRIRQVLINLLGNSVKFTQKGSVFVCVWAAHFPKSAPPTAESDRAGPAVSWVSKDVLDLSGGGRGATLRRAKLAFGSPNILVAPAAGPSGIGGSFREDDGRRISKSSMFGSLRLGRSARFSEPSKPGEHPGGILKSASALGSSSRFKHVTISIPDPAGEEPSTSEERRTEDRRTEETTARSASFSQKLKMTLSGLTKGALLRKGGEREEAGRAPEKQTVPPAGSTEDSDGARSRARRRSFEIYDRTSNSMRRDIEMGSTKETPEGRLREVEKDASTRGGENGSASDLPEEDMELRVFFRVEDTGPGVPPNVQSKLFRPFQQADSSTSRKFGGTGIGLVISERLITLMGGSVMAWSETDVGTSFQFDVHMPAVDLAPPTPSSGGQSPVANHGTNWQQSSRAPSDFEGARAIVVQDEDVRREVAVGILQRMQMHVVGVCNCTEALELAVAAYTLDADQKARGESPSPSPRGYGVLRHRLTKSGISSTPGDAGNLLDSGGEQSEETGAGGFGPAPGNARFDTGSQREGGGETESTSTRETNSESSAGQVGGETNVGGTRERSQADGVSSPSAIVTTKASHQRLESRGSVSSSSSGASVSSPIADQGRLPSLQLWNMEEGDESGEDKDIEKVIAAGEKALRATEQNGVSESGFTNQLSTSENNSANLRGLSAGSNATGSAARLGANPEIEQVSLSGGAGVPESTTPTFRDVMDGLPVGREPFGRAPADADVSADITPDEDARLALQDAAEGGRFRVVLVDVDCVGKVSALEFAKQVKDDPRLSELLVVGMCVGGPHNQENGRGDEAKAVGLLGPVFKPLRRGALAAVLHGAMHPEGADLPRSPPGEETTPTSGGSTPVGSVPLDGKKILVVDDVAINVKVASRMIAAFKCQVLTAASGQEAIDIFRREQGSLDLILMDVQMPEMDGFEATQKIREIIAENEALGAPRRKLPILALTADVMSGTKEECLKAGMDGYLPKPLNPKKLKELLHEFIGSE
ncbi:Signal transduction histidine kinase [Klebsormidium nitens]|uniref:Signal transduction histidine kinase n=1 Tax=Klebsormidium nitens TaxID=105231 RepID=A0A1Y1HM10_KLENI|nr:Signal transduction histidine kinase [Klebsormidium nitens]|eukprot:GAQ79650.1 Signal transduction histidine kinase [Klebsormidium nitens]